MTGPRPVGQPSEHFREPLRRWLGRHEPRELGRARGHGFCTYRDGLDGIRRRFGLEIEHQKGAPRPRIQKRGRSADRTRDFLAICETKLEVNRGRVLAAIFEFECELFQYRAEHEGQWLESV